MTIQIPLRMTESDVAALDELIADGRFRSRSHALREGFARLLREERDRAIDDAYRRGYGEHPQEDWVGASGLAAFAALDHAEGGERL